MVSNCLLVYVPISGLYSLVGVLFWVPLFSIILIGEVGRRLFVSFSFGYIIVAFQKKKKNIGYNPFEVYFSNQLTLICVAGV